MSNSVDQRVVEMQFDNREFNKNVDNTIEAVKKLDQNMQLKNGAKGLMNIQSGLKKFSVAGAQAALGTLGNGFHALGSTAMSVFDNIAAKVDNIAHVAKIGIGGAVAAVGGLAVSGGIKRAMNLEHANFQLQGLLKNEEAVKKVMDDVNASVKGTAYGLDEAAVIASQLTASNVKASAEGGEMLNVLQAIAGTAAMGGRTFSDVGQIFATVAGQGKLMTMQLRQMETMGLNAAATLADYLTKTGDGAEVTEEQVREMVTQGEIDFATFASAMSSAFGEHAKKANETFTGAMSNVKAALSRIGAEFATPSLENLRKIFVSLIPVIDTVKASLAPVVDLFKQITGKWTDSIVDILKPWSSVDKEGKTVLNFSDALGKRMQNLTQYAGMAWSAFDKIGGTASKKIGEGFQVIGHHLNKAFGSSNIKALTMFQLTMDSIVRTLGPAVEYLGQVHNRFLEVTLTNVEQALPGIYKVGRLAAPVIQEIGRSFTNAFPSDGDNPFKGLGKAFTEFMSTFSYNQDAIDKIGAAFDRIFGALRGAGTIAVGAFKGIGEALKGLIEGVSSFAPNAVDGMTSFFDSIFGGIDAEKIASGLESVGKAFGDIFRAIGSKDFSLGPISAIIDFIHSIADAAKDIGLIDAITTKLGELIATITGGPVPNGDPGITLITDIIHRLADFGKSLPEKIPQWFHNLKESISEFAKACGLSKSDILGLINTMSVGLATLISTNILRDVGSKWYNFVTDILGSMYRLTNWDTDGRLKSLQRTLRDFFQGIATSIKVVSVEKIAISIGLLAGALWLLSSIDDEELTKGFVALMGVSIVLANTFNALSASVTKVPWGTLGSAAAMLVGLGAALILMAGAVKIFGSMDLVTLGKGFVAVTVGLGLMVVAVNMLAKAEGPLVKATAAFTGIVVAMYLLAGVIAIFGHMKIQTLVQGFVVLAAALIVMGVALSSLGAIEGRIVSAAAAMLIMANAMIAMSIAIKLLGSMSFEQLAVAMIALGGGLTILAMAMILMQRSIQGAAAMVVAAVALGLLAPALLALSAIPIGSLVVALLGIAGTFLVLGVAAEVLTPIIPSLFSLAGAVALLGLSVAGIGAGLALLAAGLATLAVSGVAGFMALGNGIVAFVNIVFTIIPQIASAIATGITMLIVAIGEHIPVIVETIVSALSSLILGLQTLIPQFVELGVTILSSLLQGLMTLVPQVIETGVVLITSLLSAIQIVVPQFVQTGVMVILSLAMGLVEAIPALVEIATLGIITTVNALANTIREHHQEMYDAGKNLFMAILEAMADIFSNLVTDIGGFIMDIPAYISGEKQLFADAATEAGESAKSGLNESMADLPDEASTSMDKVYSAIEDKSSSMDGAFSGLSTSLTTAFESIDLGSVSEKKVDELTKPLQDTEVMSKAGQDLGTAGGEGFEKTASKWKDTAKAKSKETVSSAKEGASGMGSAGRDAGSNFGSGIYNGMGSWMNSICNRAKQMVRDAKNSANNEQNAASPSKDMIKSGMWFGMGFEIGIRNMIPSVKIAAASMVDEAKNEFDFGSDVFGLDDIETQPVIRPVLDLTDYNAGLRSMRGIDTTPQMVSAQFANRAFGSPVGNTTNYGNNNSVTVVLDWNAGESAIDAANMIARTLQSRNLMEA